MYYKKATKFGSQNFGYQIWFCTRLLNIKTVFPGMDIVIIKIRQPWDCCIFITGILELVQRCHVDIEMPRRGEGTQV